MRRALLLLFLAAGLLASCGPSSPSTPAPLGESCRVQLPPRTPVAPVAAAPQAAAAPPVRSRLVTDVEIPLAPLLKELETSIPTRLDEQRGQSIGIGDLNYIVDRGPLRASIANDSLVVQTDIRSHAEACRGNNCFASCDPQGRATAMIPLRLLPDWRFAPSRVTFAFTRGCEVRTLGGFMKIDVTPQIDQRLQPLLRRVEKDIDARLPPVRPRAEMLWAELGKTRSLPLGACAVTNAEGLIEGPISGASDRARIRFGVLAHPEIRRSCAAAATTTGAALPLPPLAQDPAMPPEDDVVVTMLAPLSAVVGGLEGPTAFDAGKGLRARVTHATAAARGAEARVDLTIRGDACGDLSTSSPIAWSEDGRSLKLAAPSFDDAERQRIEALAPDTLARSLSALHFASPLDPDSLKDLGPSMAKAMADPNVEVNVKVTSAKPLHVTLRQEDLAAAVQVRASVDLRLRSVR